MPIDRSVIVKNKVKLMNGETRPALSPSSERIIGGASAVLSVFSLRFKIPDLRRDRLRIVISSG